MVSTLPPSTPVNAPAPHELEARIRINRCVDLYSYVCAFSRTKDPTGEVRRDSEGEVEALRIYESIIRSRKRLTRTKIEELLVQKIYTPERTGRVRELFADVKEHLLHFIEAQPFQALSVEDKRLLKSRVERVKLELPPPMSVYADEPGLFTRNDVFYERSRDQNPRIRVGGALLFTVKSRFNLAFTLAHELAHSIDPCELKADDVDILSYRGLSECFGTPVPELSAECKPEGKLSEIFADWVATHVVADVIAKSSSGFTRAQTRTAVYSAVRDLCREEDSREEDSQESKEEGISVLKAESKPESLSSEHPNEAYRVNRIFAQHPQIRKYLGCKETEGPELPGMPSYCFWPVGKKANVPSMPQAPAAPSVPAH